MLISLHGPYIEPGNLTRNLLTHINLIDNSDSIHYVFPELSITDYNFGDLFFNSYYFNNANKKMRCLHHLCRINNKIAILRSPF